MIRGAKSNVVQLPQGLSVVSGAQRSRIPRRPSHTFNIEQRPYELTPFLIAPVLAGETLKYALLQARTVSSTLKAKLIGHHLEHYIFYVKLRDLADRDDIVKMLMNTTSANVQNAASDKPLLHVSSGAPDWMQMCMDSVVKHYFRDEGDTAPHVGDVTGLPMVQWKNVKSFAESLIPDSALPAGAIVDQQRFGHHEYAYQAWEYMRSMQLTEMSFEDYLATFGVKMAPGEELNKPELLRMTANWTYPSNTVDGDGSINTQASWSIMERLDKDRFFKEPGFVVGFTVWRPKLYLGNKKQAAVSLMDNALHWLPATMKEEIHSSLVRFNGNDANSPFIHTSTPVVGDGNLDSENIYWLDIRDLLVFGDDFTNVTRDSSINAVMPENILTQYGKKYPLSSALQSIGVTEAVAETDGVVSFNILGTQTDMT